jgi:hypothetical protein
MKKIFIILVLCVIHISGYCQTKAETAEWIIGKFKKWKVPDARYNYSNGTLMGGTTEVPNSLSFINCEMTFKSRESYLLSIDSYYDLVYSFNFGDVKSVEWIKAYDNNLLVITTNGRVIKQSIYSKKEFSLDNNKNSAPTIKYLDKCIIAFDIYGEDDFKSRMVKALYHFQTFCSPSIKAKEVF